MSSAQCSIWVCEKVVCVCVCVCVCEREREREIHGSFVPWVTTPTNTHIHTYTHTHTHTHSLSFSPTPSHYLSLPVFPARTLCGTPNYIAPEILEGRKGHSFEVDVWSIGCILYTLLFGKPPFETRDIKTTYRKIRHNDYSIPAAIKVTADAEHLIRNLLHPDPSKRPSLDAILEHPFITAHFVPATLPVSALTVRPTFSGTPPMAVHDLVAESNSAHVGGAVTIAPSSSSSSSSAPASSASSSGPHGSKTAAGSGSGAARATASKQVRQPLGSINSNRQGAPTQATKTHAVPVVKVCVCVFWGCGWEEWF